MKKIKSIIFSCVMFVIFLTNVKASNYDIKLTQEHIKAKPGEIAEIEIFVKDIDMGKTGVNTIEGYINYDKDLIESIEIQNENEWKTTYNSDTTSNLYGKFLTVKDEGVKHEEKIATLKLKIKDKVTKSTSKIEIKDITSNDGENLVIIGDKEAIIEFEGVEVVNTGDVTLVLGIGLISLMIVLNILLNKKKVIE